MKLGITMLIHNKDDIEFVTEFPCLLGHPVYFEVLLDSRYGDSFKETSIEILKKSYFSSCLSTSVSADPIKNSQGEDEKYLLSKTSLHN